MIMPIQDYGRNRRKNARRVFGYPARILLGREVSPATCVIIDISESGAQLQVPAAAAEIPEEFALLIGGRADVQRRCRVMWRTHNKIGVQFLGKPQRR
jgi:PilZ domain